jgi:hypothetical protein
MVESTYCDFTQNRWGSIQTCYQSDQSDKVLQIDLSEAIVRSNLNDLFAKTRVVKFDLIDLSKAIMRFDLIDLIDLSKIELSDFKPT